MQLCEGYMSTPDWRDLAHRTEFEGIQLLTDKTAEAIDPLSKIVSARDRGGLR